MKNKNLEISQVEKNKFFIQREAFDVYVPHFYYEKIEHSLESELSECSKDPSYDPYGFNTNNRNHKHNFRVFRQKAMFLVGLIYYLMTPKQRVNKGEMLCADLSENYLSHILGDCTRNRTKIGWKTIRQFLMDHEIIEICDNTYIHDSIYGLQPQCMAYTLHGLSGVKHKPKAHVYKKTGKRGCTCKKFKYNDFLLEKVHIDESSLLNSLSKNRVRYVKSNTVLGLQSVMLTKLGILDEDYEYVKKNIMGIHDKYKLRAKFSDLRYAKINRSKKSTPHNIRRKASLKFLKAVHENTPFEISCTQSVKTSRIYSGLTTLKKEARPFLFVKEFPNERLVEIDFKACQLTLLTLLYAHDTHDYSAYKEAANGRGDFYERLARRCNFMSNSNDYTRDIVKKELFHYIFSNRYYDNKSLFVRAIASILGRKFVNYVYKVKGRKHTGKLARKLQELEARVFIGKWDMPVNKCGAALCTLYQHGIFALSIHDSLVVMEKDAEMALKYIKHSMWTAFKHIFGFDISCIESLLKVKVWEKPDSK